MPAIFGVSFSPRAKLTRIPLTIWPRSRARRLVIPNRGRPWTRQVAASPTRTAGAAEVMATAPPKPTVVTTAPVSMQRQFIFHQIHDAAHALQQQISASIKGRRQQGAERQRQQKSRQQTVRRSDCSEPVHRPPPTRPPTRAWVVEIGRPSRVANRTVRAEPMDTATAKAPCPSASGETSPLPENAVSSSYANSKSATEPA